MAAVSNITTSVTTRRLDYLIDLSLGTSNAATAVSSATLKVRLGSSAVTPTNTVLMTEITAGSGYTTGGAAVVFGAASGGVASNTAAVTWTNMPATASIANLEITDTNGRLYYGALGAAKTTNAGDTFSFAISAITITFA